MLPASCRPIVPAPMLVYLRSSVSMARRAPSQFCVADGLVAKQALWQPPTADSRFEPHIWLLPRSLPKAGKAGEQRLYA